MKKTLADYEYYRTDLGVLYCGDCLEIMPMLEPVDLVLTDPPYGATACEWDSVIPLDKMWKRLNMVVKPNSIIIMTASQPFTTLLIASNIKMFKYCWYWKKTKAIGFAGSKNRPMKIVEECCVFSKGLVGHKNQVKNNRMKYNPQGIRPLKEKVVSAKWHGNTMGARPNQVGRKYLAYTGFPNDLLLDFKNPIGNKTIHPTQKPVALMEYLIKTYTNEGEVVLDFTIGSGTTAVACERLNRHWIGIEISEEYCAMAKKRIHTETRSLRNRFFRDPPQTKLQGLFK